jgi:hypothetical protein
VAGTTVHNAVPQMRGGVQVGGYGGEFVADRADRIGAQRQAQRRLLCADLAARLFIEVDTVKSI